MRFTSPTMHLAIPMAILGISIHEATATCSDGLVNVVFNIGRGNPGWSLPQWTQIHSASNWLTFNLTAHGHLDKQQVPMMGDHWEAVKDAVDLVNSDDPPDYMVTFNEPDQQYNAAPGTVKVYPKDAANLTKYLMAHRGTHTKFIAPVPANENSNWLNEFFGNCTGCRDEFEAYAIHVYEYKSDVAITRIENFHNKWNDKPLWVSEIARHSLIGCPPVIDWANTTSFMEDIFKWGQKTDWVDKIFWNSGNEGYHCDANIAASFLLYRNDTPSPLLKPFNDLTCV